VATNINMEANLYWMRPKSPEVVELTEHGVELDYAMYQFDLANNEVVVPHGTLDNIKKNWAVKGDQVLFLNRGGYESQPKQLLERLWANDLIPINHEETIILTVKYVDIGRSSSTYIFKEIDGRYNTVMFRRIKNA
jgi:hypothetical protein